MNKALWYYIDYLKNTYSCVNLRELTGNEKTTYEIAVKVSTKPALMQWLQDEIAMRKDVLRNTTTMNAADINTARTHLVDAEAMLERLLAD